MPSTGLVLVTGVSGFIGGQTLHAVLEEGFSVRAVVRKESQAADIKAAYPGAALDFVVVPDFSAPNAYAEAVKGVDHVLHLATAANFAPEDGVTDVLDPTIASIISLMEAAAGQESIKTFVLTSSIVAYYNPVAAPPTKKLDAEDYSELDYAFVEALPKPHAAYGLPIYATSKVLGEKAAWKFVEEKKPSFRFLTLAPGHVTGPNYPPIKDVKELSSTGAWFYDDLLVKKEMAPFPGMTNIDVRDVAKAHVAALTNTSANGRYVLSSTGDSWEQGRAAKIVGDLFPQKKHLFATPPKSELEQLPITFDTTNAERDLGLDSYITLEKSLKDWATDVFAALDKLDK